MKIMKIFFRICEIIKEIQRRSNEHHATAYAAQLAYFIILSIFPLLIFLFSIFGRFSLDSERIIKILLNILPQESAIVISNYIQNMVYIEHMEVMPVFAFATLLAASRGMTALIQALNVAYGVKENRGYILRKLMGVLYTFVLVLILLITAILPMMSRKFFDVVILYFPLTKPFFDIFEHFRWILVYGFTIFGVLWIYKAIPNKKLKMEDTIYGSIFAILGWLIMSFGFSYFVNHFANYSILYGSLAALIILMMWFYFTAIIIIIGGEINSMTADGLIKPISFNKKL